MILAISFATALTAGAIAQSDSRQSSSYLLTQERPGRGTSERFLFDYRDPSDPQAKPPAVRRVVTIGPRGSRFDTSAPESCTASDAELTAQGGAACPAGSAIGGGVVTVDTGFPGPGRIVTADIEFFNNATDPAGEFIYVNTVRGSGARTVIRADVNGRKTITNAGMLPGAPPEGGAIDTVDVTVENVSRNIDGEVRNYIMTPRRCRGRRSDPHWTTRVEFTYSDGVTQTVPTHTTCRKRRAR